MKLSRRSFLKLAAVAPVAPRVLPAVTPAPVAAQEWAAGYITFTMDGVAYKLLVAGA